MLEGLQKIVLLLSEAVNWFDHSRKQLGTQVTKLHIPFDLEMLPLSL